MPPSASWNLSGKFAYFQLVLHFLRHQALLMPNVTVNGVDTYYEREGNPDGQSIVFIHGATLDHRLWWPHVPALEEEYDLIAYDYRGHGKTSSTDRSEYSVSLLVDDLRALLEELDIDRPVLCGHSAGGLIASEYAIEYSDDVAGLVFADARTDLGERPSERVMFRALPLFHRAEDIVGRERMQRVMEIISSRINNASSGPNEEPSELGMTPSEYFESTTENTPRKEQRKLVFAGMEYVGASPTDFDVPVLYAYGELTADVIAEKANRLERAPTDVRVAEIEDGGHGFPIEQPEAFVEVLENFLEGLPGR